MSEVNPMVLVYLANGLGNCVLAIPALKALSLLGYDVDLGIPTEWSRSKPLLELFKGQPFVRKIVSRTEQVSPSAYARIFVPNTHEKTGLRVYLEQQNNAVIVRHPNWRDTVAHEADYMMEMARFLGYAGPKPNLSIATSKVESLPPKPYITLAFSCLEGHPWLHKRWPTTYWVDLLNILLRKLPAHQFAFVGSATDDAEAKTIISRVNSDKVHSYCGKFSVGESAELIANSECLVTVDNGVSHVAAATDLKSLIVLYGPTLLSKNIPLHRNIKILRSGLDCSPCFGTRAFSACTSNECMKAITPECAANEIMLSSMSLHAPKSSAPVRQSNVVADIPPDRSIRTEKSLFKPRSLV